MWAASHDRFLGKMLDDYKWKLQSPYGRGQIMADIITLRAGAFLKSLAPAAETKMVTLYRGTTYYDALEAVGNNAVNMERVVQRQLSAGYAAERQGLYLTTQESTAQFYADLAGLQGRGGGPAVLRFEVPEAQFQQFLQRNSIRFEAPVPRPPFPGQTETLIPTSAANEFNSLSNIFHH